VQIDIRTENSDTVIAFAGTLDGAIPPPLCDRLQSALSEGQRFVLDLSRLAPLSAAGERVLLLLVRRIKAVGATVSVLGVHDEVIHLAEAAGFLVLFPSPLPEQGAAAPRNIILPRVDVYPSHYQAGFGLRPGFPIPFGASLVPGGVNFSVFSRHARSCALVLLDLETGAVHAEIPFPPEFRIGDAFAMTVLALDVERFGYGFRMDGPCAPARGHRFDPSRILLDPNARAVSGRNVWGAACAAAPCLYQGMVVPDDFDWEGDRPPELPSADLVLYEMHLRGFTRSSSSGVRFPGTFAGLRDKVPYLKELGVNAVELMPVFEFDERDNPRLNPLTGEQLFNYWGYSTLGFRAPKAGYAATGPLGMQADEFKALVRDMHRAGIEVILDVVFNHTGEGDEKGPTISFRGLDNSAWYMLRPDGSYLDFSGCGNTLNCNHPVVRDFVLNCLRYWAAEYHIDGFRFDLASILGRAPDGTPLGNPPLLEALALDPVLSKTRLIAEAWDAGGLYQVGRFPAYGRWAEWNGKYRDCLRRFLKGDPDQTTELAQRLMGSPDLYGERGTSASINFITCHDGFTLWDLVSYNAKHNEANGEANRDGTEDNLSWNCGIEGPTNDPGVLALRRRQVKNALTILFLSQGIPMLLMGDECARTQEGNNNAYCHDSPLTWMDWGLPKRNAELLRYCQHLIAFRRQHPALRYALHAGRGGGMPFLEVSWHGTRPWCPDWSPNSRSLAFLLRGSAEGREEDVLYAVLNAYWETLDFEPPTAPAGRRWHVFANTGRASPEDVWEPGSEPPLAEQGHVRVSARSVVVLVARE
jgi:glycogen operon protein